MFASESRRELVETAAGLGVLEVEVAWFFGFALLLEIGLFHGCCELSIVCPSKIIVFWALQEESMARRR